MYSPPALAPTPQWIEPELCQLVTRIPAGDNWAPKEAVRHRILIDNPAAMYRFGRAG